MTAARTHRHRPIPKRRTTLASVLALALLLVGMLALVNLLRHPFPGGQVTLPPPVTDDPRAEIDCPTTVPVEGSERAAPEAGPGGPPELVSSNALYDCPEAWHGRRVVYRGEAVGAVLRRDAGAWVQLNDDIYAGDLGPLPAHRDFRGGNAGVGVLIPLELADGIERVGGPRDRGDIVEVTGVFQRVDPVSREVAVILAEGGDVVARGAPVSDPVLVDRAVAAVVLALLAAALAVAERVSARRWR